jgi:hypothetical protein
VNLKSKIQKNWQFKKLQAYQRLCCKGCCRVIGNVTFFTKQLNVLHQPKAAAAAVAAAASAGDCPCSVEGPALSPAAAAAAADSAAAAGLASSVQ